MSFMKKSKARILSITKDDMQTCSSKVIWAKVVIVESGEVYGVAWAQSPTVIGVTGVWRSRAQDVFPIVWKRCEVGDEVWLHHAADYSFNYLEPYNT